MLSPFVHSSMSETPQSRLLPHLLSHTAPSTWDPAGACCLQQVTNSVGCPVPARGLSMWGMTACVLCTDVYTHAPWSLSLRSAECSCKQDFFLSLMAHNQKIISCSEPQWPDIELGLWCPSFRGKMELVGRQEELRAAFCSSRPKLEGSRGGVWTEWREYRGGQGSLSTLHGVGGHV